jgi:hypothetical protein
MNATLLNGLYLFPKTNIYHPGLREMLQFLKTHSPGKSVPFSYVECETALIPQLSLWENLKMVVGGQNWQEAITQMTPEFRSLASLISTPHILGEKASDWEKLSIGLLKAVHTKKQNLLIDINEEKFSSFNLSNFKKTLFQISANHNVILSTPNPQLWLNVSQGIIKKEGFKFLIDDQSVQKIKNLQSA